MGTEVSVIIPTYNGASKIVATLTALDEQDFSDFELVVVIDGSTDNTFEIVQSFNSKFKKSIVCQPNQGRSAAKNNGAKRANGSVFIFYDDDMEPTFNSITRHLGFHSNTSGIICGNPIEADNEKKTDIQNYKAFLSMKWIEKYREGINEMNNSNLFFTAANCSFKKNDFFELNGFDERLTDAEDYDLALRAMRSNIKVYFDKSNKAIHYNPITCVGYIKRLREYYAAQQKVISFNPGENLSIKSTPEGWKKILYLIFAFEIFPQIIDGINVFIVFPKRVRYKLYNIIIHALSRMYPLVRLKQNSNH